MKVEENEWRGREKESAGRDEGRGTRGGQRRIKKKLRKREKRKDRSPSLNLNRPLAETVY